MLKETDQSTVSSNTGKIKWDDIKDWVDEDLLLYFEKLIKLDKGESIILLQEVKKYLLVANNNYNPNKNFSPSPLVDEGWHAFILFTPLYAIFCKEILKRETIIPHIPSVGKYSKIIDPSNPEGSKEPYINTINALKEEIGDLNEKYWPNPKFHTSECCTPCRMY